MRNTVKSIRITITLTALLLSGLHTMAQDASKELMPDVPPSPQAVAFNRLGDYQVNNNYGAPDISIPLFEIDHHGYKIPLALHYEASPLRPGYNYDVTGVGWTLSGNSCVSRTIKDRADEYGLFSNPFTLDPFNNQSGQPLRYMDYAGQLDQLNYQYDSYNILLPSGRTIPFFMYKSSGVMTYDLMPSDGNVRIECSLGFNSIDSFRVWDENGVKYSFRVADKAHNGFDNDVNAYRNVSWLLTSIDIPSKGIIIYEYTDLQTINTYTISEPVIRVSRLTSQRPEDNEERRINVMKTLKSQCPRYRMRFLSRIRYGPTKVDFNYYNDGQHMREIVVSENSDTIRKFTLNVYGSPYYPNWHLNSLVVSGQNDEERLAYGFTYANNNPGNYTDYWGNMCESNTNKDLGNFNMFFDCVGIDTAYFKSNLSGDGYPAQFIPKKPDDPNYYYKIKLQSTVSGETRMPTTPYKHGVLTSITYPNGGHTTFNWENHRFPTATAADGDFVFDRRRQRVIEGGGFRLESIINWTADGQIASKDYYRYGFTLGDVIRRNFPLPLPDNLNIGNISFNDTINHHIGCGEAVVDPNLLTFMSFSHATAINTPLEFQKMAVGLPSAFNNIANMNGPSWWDAYYSANTFRSLLGGRRPVVYPEITVYHGHPFETAKCMSKTVYKYDIYSYQHNFNTYYLSSFQQTAPPDTAYFEPVFYFNNGPGMRCTESPARRHRLKSKSDYSFNSDSGTWELVSEEEYIYDVDNMSKNGYIFDSDVSRGHCGRHTLQMGAGRPLESFGLFEFYKQITQRLGKSTISEKHITSLRKGGTRSEDNTVTEEYSYLYPGVPKYRYYTDICDKVDSYSYIGEQNAGADSVITAMKSKNMLAALASADTYALDTSAFLSGSKIDYAFYGNNILPSKLYERNGNVYEESAQVLSYDSYGNPTEILDLKTGMHSVFLWDIHGRYMSAMIRNATSSQVQAVLSQLTGNSRARYATLKTLLPGTLVQTWDYLPLVGVSSHTDINGQTILYEYDGLGRLKSERRVINGMSDPELLRQYEYNYMNPMSF